MSESPEMSRAPVTTPKASLREVERRRSERLLITVPIQVEGIDRTGEKFCETTQTLVINREGARIRMKRDVEAGALLLITTVMGRRSCKFRLVGPTQPITIEGREWGVECMEEKCNIWGIGFPKPAEDQGACTALLECRRCHAIKLAPLSMVEHEVLGNSGLLLKECADCGRPTSWSYKETSVTFTNQATAPLPYNEKVQQNADGPQRRVHRRAALQMPIRVRSYYGTEEMARSENVSRGGICFITDRTYEIGEVLLITCPYEKSGHNIEVRGQVVRRRDMLGTGRKIYGVAYER